MRQSSAASRCRRVAGRVVFSKDSHSPDGRGGNTHVEVTAHESSSELSVDAEALLTSRLGPGWEGWLDASAATLEWRVLRFNGTTRQSVTSCLCVPMRGAGARAPEGVPGVVPGAPGVAGEAFALA